MTFAPERRREGNDWIVSAWPSPLEKAYWADPAHRQPGQINHHDGGRGVYWNDPNGHYLEIITRPYGSGG